MKFRTSQQGSVSVISLQGSLMGGPDALALKEKVDGLIEAGRNLVVVDISSVDFVNSSGLGMLINSASSLRKTGGRMMISGASRKVLDLIKITRLSPVLETHASVDEAVAALGR